MTGLTKGNLSSHLSKLEDAKLVPMEKEFVSKRSHTLVKLTEQGRTAIEEHWQQLERLREQVQQWRN